MRVVVRASAPGPRWYPKSERSPFVILILPVTVAFAIFPGSLVLQLGF